MGLSSRCSDLAGLEASNDGLAGWFTQFHYAGWFACAAAVVRQRRKNRWAKQRRNGIARRGTSYSDKEREVPTIRSGFSPAARRGGSA
ncbi:hypothetical protein SUGI_1509630 [Cryptomeria japonica]|uniref:Uncharacterized protein n=1 Tax=Cryptomeria japonica TaxID=3369 RepID=A0AAD3NVA0_CRYJA|nr:hypothetical protein SUGI_1463140 [Cryptomeria japonica]GLJ59466.1 hypothetical protein SUGI_1509630 [Cryptomeria japonica]